ncbi:TonB-dependent receptor [Massilia sp. H-1]|nr:TonB-dependent receptor [Massilia sp. H-1]
MRRRSAITARRPGLARIARLSNPNYEQHFPGCEIDSWVRMGVRYTYTGIKNLSLNINIQNVLDTLAAPYDPASGTSTTTGAPLIGYNSSLHNPYGRYFSLQAKYTF